MKLLFYFYTMAEIFYKINVLIETPKNKKILIKKIKYTFFIIMISLILHILKKTFQNITLSLTSAKLESNNLC